MEVDLLSLLTLVGILATISSAVVEWFKALLAASTWDDNWSDEAHKALVITVALAASIGVALVAELDIPHALYPALPISHAAAIIVSGIALALPADFLKSLLQWVKAIRDAKEGQALAARSFAAPPIPHEPAAAG